MLGLLLAAFSAWSVDADLAHLPKVVEVFEDHARMVAEHGHSHGFEEDLAWALHGHAHDHGDHEHGTELLPAAERDDALAPRPEARPASRPRDGPSPTFPQDRPPQA